MGFYSTVIRIAVIVYAVLAIILALSTLFKSAKQWPPHPPECDEGQTLNNDYKCVDKN